PLSAAMSFIELAEKSGDMNERQQHFVHRAYSNLERVTSSIHALLEFAILEREDILSLEVCDVLEHVQEVVETLKSVADERRITFHINVSADAQFVQADEDMLDRVLTNLVSNAIKYNSPNGDIFITTEIVGEFIRISVRDTGLGIPEKVQDRVFDRFFRVEEKEHMRIDGTGIGLAIVKGIIMKHGGEIGVDSVLDEGSTFYFTLPIASTSSPDYNREPTDGLDDRYQEARDHHEDSDAGDAY
ncbi:MAG: HAMP domain-containing sensor histidine kinase, partial [Chloroflexota bacterium]